MSNDTTDTLPILSMETWRDLALISPNAVDEALQNVRKNGSTSNLWNAVEAGCAVGDNCYDRAESIVKDYLSQTGITLDVTLAWIDAYVAGLVDSLGTRVRPVNSDRLLSESLSLAVKQDNDGALALVQELVKRGADSGLRDENGVAAQSRKNPVGFFNATRALNVKAAELIIGPDTVYDVGHPPPQLAESGESLLSSTIATLSQKPDEGATLFRMVASHMAPGYDEPYHSVFEEYVGLRLYPNCHPTVPLSFARSLLLGVRPYPEEQQAAWQRAFDLQLSAPSAYPGIDKSQPMPFVHALIAGPGGDDLGRILWHLHEHGLDKEQGCGSANVTPLVHAAAKGKKAAVEALLEMGADTSVKVVAFDRKDPGKWLTPAEVAMACGHDEIARMILSHAAKKAIHDVVMKNEPSRSTP